MKLYLIRIASQAWEWTQIFLMAMVALLPMLLVLDFGMGIQLRRDYSFMVVISFISAMVFFAVIYSRYVLHNNKRKG